MVNVRTIEVYKDIAARLCKKAELTQDQKNQIRESWKKKRSKTNKHPVNMKELEEKDWSKTVEEVQMFGAGMKEAWELIEECNINNVIHAAKMARCGEAHMRLAQSVFAKAKR